MGLTEIWLLKESDKKENVLMHVSGFVYLRLIQSKLECCLLGL